MKRLIIIIISVFVLMAVTIPAFASSQTSQSIPTFSILDVVRDQSVTIQTSNFPANDTFTVTVGAFGTRGIDGTVIGSTDSGNGGTFKVTYTISSSLKGSDRISIRLQSPSSGYFAYNWFWNNTASATSIPSPSLTPPPSPTPSPSPTATPILPGYSGFPIFSIQAVVKDETVTIKGANFPANDTFEVLMGEFGTRGVAGIKVGSTNSGSGGALSVTYNIPTELAGSTRIAIRLQSPTSGYFAFNWFWNATTTP